MDRKNQKAAQPKDRQFKSVMDMKLHILEVFQKWRFFDKASYVGETELFHVFAVGIRRLGFHSVRLGLVEKDTGLIDTTVGAAGWGRPTEAAMIRMIMEAALAAIVRAQKRKKAYLPSEATPGSYAVGEFKNIITAYRQAHPDDNVLEIVFEGDAGERLVEVEVNPVYIELERNHGCAYALHDRFLLESALCTRVGDA